MVCMVNLCVVGFYVVNGVVVLYLELVKCDLFFEFVEFYLGKIQNVINGIILCCWLKFCNLGLLVLILEKIGYEWFVKLD